MRNFIIEICITWCNDDFTFRSQRPLINKVNLTLVQILKQEWPSNWPNFITEIVSSSRTGLNVCENNMNILRLLSEEIFDFSSEQMTGVKAENLKKQMCDEFSEIYQLCIDVLQNAAHPSLILATLLSILRYIPWVPLQFIFDTPITELLLSRFLCLPEFRNVTLKCLTEITSLKTSSYEKTQLEIFNRAVSTIREIIPIETNFMEAYESANSADQEFIQNLAIFLTSFLSNFLSLVENQGDKSFLLEVHVYVTKISEIEEREIFKICLDYWSRFVLELFQEVSNVVISDITRPRTGDVNQSFTKSALASEVLGLYPLRKHGYSEILSRLCVIMIEKMVRPEEILIVENDEGEIVRETVRESDTITLYKSMREMLVYLTHLDVGNTERIMITMLEKQREESEWSWNSLNTLCWAIGSISGAMDGEMEKVFLIQVIRELLSLTERKKEKDDKAVVASNVMYIVGQYPRFLKSSWRLLKTVVKKLFEFMHDGYEGIQDMACNTFSKIAQKCRYHFVVIQLEEREPFINEILFSLTDHTSMLQPQQVQTFYKACGYIISAEKIPDLRNRLLRELMAMPNMAWKAVMEQSKNDSELLTNPEYIKIIANIMKTNVATCSSLGVAYFTQLSLIYLDMLSLYSAVSQMILLSVAVQGPVATKTPRVRGLRTIKKEILKLIDVFISKTDNLDEVARSLAPPLLKIILIDYQSSSPGARDAEILHSMNIIVQRIGKISPEAVCTILENVFECTLSMINKTIPMDDYPTHRLEFFNLLRTINLVNFPVLLKLPETLFSQTIDACLWGAKHDYREVESTGLHIMLELLTNMGELRNSLSNAFFLKFFKIITNDILYILTDSDHKSGFKVQSLILAKLIELIDSRSITVPLYSPGEAHANMDNLAYFKEYFCTTLISAYPHLQKHQIISFLNTLISSFRNAVQFKHTLRDFLVSIKEYGGGNIEYLFAEDIAEDKYDKEVLDHNISKKIGGMVRPNDMDEDVI